jgi:hypothetical protein
MTDAFPKASDPMAPMFNNMRINLTDLYRSQMHAGGGAIIEGRTFTDCMIEGPALMLVLDGVHFDSTNFGETGGDVRNMLFRPMATMAIGAIPVRNCTFRNCRFNTLGITGSDDLLQMLTQSVKTVGLTA